MNFRMNMTAYNTDIEVFWHVKKPYPPLSCDIHHFYTTKSQLYMIFMEIIHNMHVFPIIRVSFIEFWEPLRKDDNDTSARILSLGA